MGVVKIRGAQIQSKDAPRFSNIEGSHCSSLGKYKIGERGYSAWGINIKYLLIGLEPTNRNALARTIVFHSWEKVKDEEAYPDGTPEGWGCPTISVNSMRIMYLKLKGSKSPVLMWMYQ
ncbi:MAG: murein L,D-transpeptidase catalytic domain family protein [Bacteroidota bacterium]|nr:murein L,D-transpeptidase catalytic domain family protein [Bacteroidota bacterium]